MVVIWSLLISFLVSYVINSMAGTNLDLSQTIILGVIFAIAILLIGSIGLKEEKSN